MAITFQRKILFCRDYAGSIEDTEIYVFHIFFPQNGPKSDIFGVEGGEIFDLFRKIYSHRHCSHG